MLWIKNPLCYRKKQEKQSVARKEEPSESQNQFSMNNQKSNFNCLIFANVIVKSTSNKFVFECSRFFEDIYFCCFFNTSITEFISFLVICGNKGSDNICGYRDFDVFNGEYILHLFL